MKKTYTKPEILFEDFSLSTSIAVACTYKTKLLSEDTGCGWADPRHPENVLFLNGIQGCVDGPGNYDGVCYHVPAEGNNIFSS